MYQDGDIPISPSEWQIWKNMPTTRAVFDALSEERSVLVQKLAFGDTLDKPGLEIKETAKTVGEIAGLTIILEDLELVIQQQYNLAQQRKLEKEMEEEEG